jgi:DNA-binding MarR family transcriptional regulator
MDETERLLLQAVDRFIDRAFALLIDDHHRQAAEVALTLAQAKALYVLGRGPLSTGALAGRLAISAPAVTQLVDRLAKKRLIESRRSGAGDRRFVELSLSKTGRLLIDRFRSQRNHAFTAAISRLDRADRVLVLDSLHKLAETLEAAEEGSRRVRSVEPELNTGASRTAVVPPTASNTTEKPVKGLRVRKLRLEWD